MKMPQTLLTLSVLCLAGAATAANVAPRPLVVTAVSGAAHVQQRLPCGNEVNLTTPIVKGYVQLTWLPAAGGSEVLVDLPRLTMFLAPFHVEAECRGVRGAVEFREIGAQLASAVRFKAAQTSTAGVFRFSIPKERFLIYESVIDTAPVPQPDAIYKRPSDDVTGVIDVRRRTVQFDVVLATRLHFRAGCDGGRCAIDETLPGIITMDIR